MVLAELAQRDLLAKPKQAHPTQAKDADAAATNAAATNATASSSTVTDAAPAQATGVASAAAATATAGAGGLWDEQVKRLTGSPASLLVPEAEKAAKLAEAATLPPVLLRDVDLHWLQVLAEGWAAPLSGFMREGTLVQALHFHSVLVDEHAFESASDATTLATDFSKLDGQSATPLRVSVPLPIVLPITDYTKYASPHRPPHPFFCHCMRFSFFSPCFLSVGFCVSPGLAF